MKSNTQTKIKTQKFLLPDHWATALLYGDVSGLDSQDHESLEKWLSDNPNLLCVDVKDDASFVLSHDASMYVLPTTCCTYIFHVMQ